MLRDARAQIAKAQAALRDREFRRKLADAGLPAPVSEHRFHGARKWQMDYAWPTLRLALEVDGGIWINGKHGRGSGIVKDQEKRNSAACLGWRLLVVTPRELVKDATIDMVREALAA